MKVSEIKEIQAAWTELEAKRERDPGHARTQEEFMEAYGPFLRKAKELMELALIGAKCKQNIFNYGGTEADLEVIFKDQQPD